MGISGRVVGVGAAAVGAGAAVVVGLRGRSLERQLDRDIARLRPSIRRSGGVASTDVVGEAELDGLPPPAQRYLRWMGLPGAPRVSWFRVRFRGEFRMRPDQPWMPYDAWQCNRIDPVNRLVRMRIDVGGVVPMFGRDTYVDHRGRMLGKVLGLVTVADGAGPEFDASELVTFLNDAVMVAPSMLLTPATRWSPVDDTSFDIDLTDAGTTVTARVVVDADGRPTGFTTDDRWYAGTDPPTRVRWSTPLEEWVVRPDGRRMLSRGAAVWHLPDGDFTYVRGSFLPDDLSEGA